MPEWVGDVSEFKTDNFGFQVLRGQPVSTDNYAFSDIDRVLMDKIMWQIFAHHHSNVSKLTNPMNDPTPSITLALSQAATGGNIPAGLKMCYRVSWYNSTGETAASTEQTIDMPTPVATPTIPTLATATTGGTLTAGSYFYAISAVKGSGETYASNPAAIIVPSTTSTNKNTVTLPVAPSGATHFNIYRKKDSGDFYYMAQVVVGAGTWEDNGSISPNCDKTLPVDNTTNSTNKVTLTLSNVPAGATGYRIYRSIVPGEYPAYSMLVDQTIGGTPILIQYDTYQTNEYGVPLEKDSTYGSPPKVILTTATDVTGILPTANITPLDANLDFAKYQAQQLVVHKGTAFPGTPAEAQPFYRTDEDKLYIYDGTVWVVVYGNTELEYTTKLGVDRTSTSVSFADATGLNFAAAANTDYVFEFDVIFRSAAVTTGIALAVNGPASPTLIVVQTAIPGLTGEATLSPIVQFGYARAYDVGTPTTGIDVADSNTHAIVKGIIRNGSNAGTVILRFASEVGGSQVDIKIGSVVKYRKI